MATPLSISEPVEFRVFAVRSDSIEVLAISHADRFILPRISILPHSRSAPQIQAAMLRNWQLDVFAIDAPDAARDTHPSVVVRVLGIRSDNGLTWVPISRLLRTEITDGEREYLTLLFDGTAGKGPLQRIDWIDSAEAWVESTCGVRLSQTEQIEQKSFGSGNALFRFPMEDGSECWLKAAQTNEFLSTTLLATIAPACLPKVLSEKPEWNAWLMSGGSSTLSELRTKVHSYLPNAMRGMAKLQKATRHYVGDFFALGAYDHSLATFSAVLTEMFDFLDTAMAHQTSTKVPRLSSDRLREIRRTVTQSICRLGEMELPVMVVHGDLNAGNILTCGDGCQFIDWCETYIGIPQISLEHLLLLNDLPDDEKPKSEADFRGIYRECWADEIDPAILEKAERYTPLLAILSAIHARGDWLKEPPGSCPAREAFARTLARSMDRAVRTIAHEEVLCH